MKKMSCAILAVMALTLFAFAPSFAQTTAPTEVKDLKLTAEQMAIIKEAVLQIKGIQSATGTPSKSWPEVADKALDLGAKFIGSVADVIEKIAPEVWRVFIVQQYAKAGSELIGPFGVLIIALIAKPVIERNWVAKKDSDYTFFAKVLPILAALGAGLFFFSALASNFPRVVNPKYYAVQDIFALVFK